MIIGENLFELPCRERHRAGACNGFQHVSVQVTCDVVRSPITTAALLVGMNQQRNRMIPIHNQDEVKVGRLGCHLRYHDPVDPSDVARITDIAWTGITSEERFNHERRAIVTGACCFSGHR